MNITALTARRDASPYRLADTHLFLDDGAAPYALRIGDLPPEEKPREKLLARGPPASLPRSSSPSS